MVDLKKYAYLSIAAAVSTIALKLAAYIMTNSIGLLSDACESVVNLFASIIVLTTLFIASRPQDKEHSYGHSKAEYFSSGIEGILIIAASIGIAWTAVMRIIHPVPLEELTLGIVLSTVASLVNFFTAYILARAGRKYESITLEADAQHLMVDVWTSVAVILGVFGVWLTGINVLDPIIALVVMGNLVFSGFQLVSRSIYGLMDGAIPEKEIKAIEEIFERYKEEGVQFHALRTRLAGSRRFVSFHILVPGVWQVSKAHRFVEDIEHDIRQIARKMNISTHIEPIEDEEAYQDIELDRDEEKNE